jgi:acetyltransferase-like isoleucine patch superfamily enzyme
MSNLYQFLSRASAFYWLQKTQRFDRHFFGAIGHRSRIIRPLKLRNPQNIFIGSLVTIADYVWLLTLPGENNHTPKLVIGDGCAIGHFNHITAVNSVELGAKVLTADRVHISDNSHGYQNIAVPVLDQPVISKGPVVIGEGTWIGENVSVLSCRIGRNCVIGANAVVTTDVPDYCVVAGVPGRILKQYDMETRTWKRKANS